MDMPPAPPTEGVSPAAGPAPRLGGPAPQPNGPGDPAWERLVKADPSGAMKALLGRHQLTKAQNQAMFTQMDTLARLARSAVDQPSYEAAVREANDLGIDTSNMPREFDPDKVNAVELQALTAKEHLQQERADRSLDWNIQDDEIDNDRADQNETSLEDYRTGQLSNTRRGQDLTDARGRRGQDLSDTRGRRGQDMTDSRGRRGQDMTDTRVRGSAGYNGRGGRGASSGPAPARAVNPKNGHAIVIRGGQWVDEASGQPVT